MKILEIRFTSEDIQGMFPDKTIEECDKLISENEDWFSNAIYQVGLDTLTSLVHQADESD